MKTFLLLTLSLLGFQSLSVDAEDGWEDDWQEESPLSFNQELSYGYAGVIKSDSANQKNAVLNEFLWLSQLDYQGTGYAVSSEVLANIDRVTDEEELAIRQLNLFFSVGNHSDVKIGRQIITWGTGDLVFLNDLFAKDWQSFFNGRDDRFLKPPVDALRFSHYRQIVNFEIAYLPDFTPDITPNGDRYSFFVSPSGIVQPDMPFSFNIPNHSELAARIFKNSQGIEWSVYFYTGFFKSPTRQEIDDNSNYAEMDSLGASMRMPLAGGLFNIESSYYRSNEDPAGDNPLVQNSQMKLLVGFEKEVQTNLTLGVQAYVEKTLDYAHLIDNLPPANLVADEYRTLLTIRLTHLALDQNLVNSLMMFSSPSDKDYYLRYSSRYTVNDHWKIIAGFNWLDGKQESTFLSQMQDNSNLFVRVQYNFN